MIKSRKVGKNMNKRKKALFGMLTSLVLLFGATTTAFADEETLAGDEVVPCTVTFSVTDATYSYEGDIEVLMNDVTGTSNKICQFSAKERIDG